MRALEPADVELLYTLENNMKLWPVSHTIAPFSRHQLQQYIAHSRLDVFQTRQLRLLIERIDDGLALGLIDLYDFDPFHRRGGIGILIDESYRGEGYAKEALGLFVSYLFGHLGLHQIYASVSATNLVSIKLFTGSGFEQAGIRRQWRRCGSEFVDEHFLQLFNPQEPHL